MPATNELEKLRNILYGDQLREVIDRIAALENNLQSLSEQINGKIVALDSETKKNKSTHKDELKRIELEQSQKLMEQSQGLVGKIDRISRQLENEAKQSKERDGLLKQELMTLLANLESGTVARQQLSRSLIELGKSIQNGQ